MTFVVRIKEAPKNLASKSQIDNAFDIADENKYKTLISLMSVFTYLFQLLFKGHFEIYET